MNPEITIEVFRGLIFLLGTIATLVFIFKGHRDVDTDA